MIKASNIRKIYAQLALRMTMREVMKVSHAEKPGLRGGLGNKPLL